MFQYICTYLTKSDYRTFLQQQIPRYVKKGKTNTSSKIWECHDLWNQIFNHNQRHNVNSCLDIRKMCIPSYMCSDQKCVFFFNKRQRSVLKSFTNQANIRTDLKLIMLFNNEDLFWSKSRLNLKLHKIHTECFILHCITSVGGLVPLSFGSRLLIAYRCK